MSDKITKRLDRINSLLKQLERDLPEIEQGIDRLNRDEAALRERIGRLERRDMPQPTMGAIFPAPWKAIATHQAPELMQ